MNAVLEKKLEPFVYNFHPNKDAMHEREEMSSNYYQQRKGILQKNTAMREIKNFLK